MAWLLPRSALGGTGRGVLLALLPALLLLVTAPDQRPPGCWCCSHRMSWSFVAWQVRQGALPGLLLLAAGVGTALGGALAVRPPDARGAPGAGRAFALAGVQAAGVLGPLCCFLLDDWSRRRWIVASIQAMSPLPPSDLTARLMLVGSLGAGLVLAFALPGLRRPAATLGVRARLGIAACGLSVAFFGLPGLWFLVG